MDKWTEGEAVQPKEREKKEKKEEQEDKPSRLWIFYHFWAAFCVKLYIDVSGFSQYVLGSLSGSDRESASNYAEYSTILLVVLMILGYLLSKALVTSIDGWMEYNQQSQIFPKIYFTNCILRKCNTSFGSNSTIICGIRGRSKKSPIQPPGKWTEISDSFYNRSKL